MTSVQARSNADLPRRGEMHTWGERNARNARNDSLSPARSVIVNDVSHLSDLPPRKFARGDRGPLTGAH